MSAPVANALRGEDLSAVVAILRELAATITGFSPEAVLPEALRRALRNQLSSWSIRDIIVGAERRDARLLGILQQAVSVGETYFFRHPEQFEHLCHVLLPALTQSRKTLLRPWTIWSAGCATGEETYSLAACFAAARGQTIPADVKLQIVGTDLLERNVRAAQEGSYGRWSVRASGPALFPLWTPASADRVRVIEPVRQLVTFTQHNLLETPPLPVGQVDVIFCRNVLVYFSPEATQKVVEHLVNALAPGGFIAFGPMDLPALPAGLARTGPTELQIFRRTSPHDEVTPPPLSSPLRIPTPGPRPRPLTPRQVEERTPPPVVQVRAIEPVAVHLKVLDLVESGNQGDALRMLDDLCRRAPDYIAGLTEHALLLGRTGEVHRAAARMREVLTLTSTMPEETLLPGPEPLPVAFYVSSAEAFLERLERSHP